MVHILRSIGTPLSAIFNRAAQPEIPLAWQQN
jgi:hypothetical protein